MDPETDAKVTLRDMLCHRTGLGGTDLAWITGTLNRDEVIRAAAFAKPTAKLGEKWQYQNVMYSAAGQCAGKAHGSTWDKVIAERFFKPLGMNKSDTSVAAMQKSNDFSRGYNVDDEFAKPILLPTRDLTNIAPAGAINSGARDMSQWLRFLLGGGEFEGKRLVSKPNFDECLKKQISMGGPVGYAFGWATMKWHGHDLAAHSGGIDGFNSYVGVIPEKHVGVVVLTNVSASPIAASISEAVWSNFADPEAAASQPATQPTEPPGDPQKEVGSYAFEAAGFNIDVDFKDGKLQATVPGQPTYTLINVGGRRYKLEGADGFFMTFRPAKGHADRTEMFLEQPHGNYVLPKRSADDAKEAAADAYDGPNKDLIGDYEAGPFHMKITARDGKVVAIVPGQPVYTLTPIEGDKDGFTMPPAPKGFEIHVKRDGEKVTRLLIKQPPPQEDMTVTRVASPPKMNVDDVIAKVIKAAGGEANLRKHKTAVTVADINFVSEGVTGVLTSRAKAPFSAARHTEFHALGRTIGTIDEIYDGTRGCLRGSFVAQRPMSKDAADEMRLESAFYGPLQWKELYKSISITGAAKVGGDDCAILELKPAKGAPLKAYVSTKTWRILRRDLTKTESGASSAVTELYSDFRDIDGVSVPFLIKQQTKTQGDSEATITIKEVKFDADVPDSVFVIETR
jgi:CubicO group peptidase (beta-lactamase class C family)